MKKEMQQEEEEELRLKRTNKNGGGMIQGKQGSITSHIIMKMKRNSKENVTTGQRGNQKNQGRYC